MGIHLCMHLLNSFGFSLAFTALLFGRRGRFLIAIMNMLWKVRYFWLNWFFQEFFTISTGVDVLP